MREYPWNAEALSDLIRWRFVMDLADRRELSLLNELESADQALWTQAYPLADQVLERTDECRDHHLLGTVTASEFVATMALTSAAVMHQKACRKPKDPRQTAPPRFCRDEVALVQDLVCVLCKALHIIVKASLLERIAEIMTARRASLDQAVDALSGAISHKITLPVLAARPKPAIDKGVPNVIINVPSSLLRPEEAASGLSRARRLADVAVTHGLRAHVTAQWPKPIGTSDGQRTSEVMVPMHYASAIFTVTEKGSLGTTQSIAFAEDHSIPSLIIDTAGHDFVEYRNPGGWTHRRRVESRSAEDDQRVVSEFIEAFGAQIFGRNRSLTMTGDFVIPPTRPVDWLGDSVEPTVFATSWVPFARVRAILSDDLVWCQTPPVILREIACKLGRLTAPEPRSGGVSHAGADDVRHRDWLEFFVGFIGFAETAELDHDDMGRLMTAYFRAENQSPISARDDVPLHSKDWQSLLNELPNDDE